MREWLLNLFRDLETAVPPDAGCHHALLRTHRGAGATWEERLELRLGVADGPTYFLDEADLRRPTQDVAEEVARRESERRAESA